MRGALCALVVGALGCGRFGFDARALGDGGDGGGDDDAPGDGTVPVATCVQTMPTGTVLHVDAIAGDDSRTGTAGNPVRTITRAIALAQPGTTILVEPGAYSAEPQNELHIENRDLKIISAQRYRASFPRFECFTCDGLLIEGFEITGSTNVCAQVSFGVNVTLRDNVIHGCGSAAVRFAGNITGSSIVGNVIYDAPNALIHVNDDSSVNIVDNVVFDNTAMGAYPVIWLEGTINTRFARNVVFHNKHDSAGYGTVSIGSAQNLVIENNIIGPNDTVAGGGGLGLDDADGTATIRFNTFMGPLPGSAFAITKNAGVTVPSTFTVTHNIFWTPSMTSQSFSTAAQTGTDGFTLDRNLYYNGGSTFFEPAGTLGPTDDPRALSVDPQLALGSASPPGPPIWAPDPANKFTDFSATTCEVRTKLIEALAAVPATSPVAGRGLITPPATDILGKPRPMPAALGAVEP